MSQYANISDMVAQGLPAAAVAELGAHELNEALVATSGLIDTRLRPHHTLPLSYPYPPELTYACVCITRYRVMVRRGYNPDEHDEEIRAAHDYCQDWLKELARGEASLSPTADATPTLHEGGPQVSTGGSNRIQGTGDPGASRGW